MSPHIVGLTGATCSGKTSLAEALKARLAAQGHTVVIIHQDDYYNDGNFGRVGRFENWDHPSAINWPSLDQAIDKAVEQHPPSGNLVVLVEGSMILAHTALVERLGLCLTLDLSLDACKQRRMARDSWLRENSSYFDDCIWPEHLKYAAWVAKYRTTRPHRFVQLPELLEPTSPSFDAIAQQIASVKPAD